MAVSSPIEEIFISSLSMSRRAQFVMIIGLASTQLLAQPPGMGARNWDDFDIAPPQPVAGNIYNVVGGIIVNMAISVGDDGIVLVDSNFAALSDKIIAAIREISDEPIRFVIDTHDHADHADGNVTFGRAGAIIVAHTEVRARLADPAQGASAPAAALPIVTFDDEMSFHLNGERVDAIHVTAGHTDGDVLVFFRESNVIHMGDVFVGQYPIIDVTRGGSYLGLLETLDRAIALVGADTRIIPGHGPISNRDDMIEYRDMLREIFERVTALAAAGRSIEQIIALNPSQNYDERWAGGRGSEGIIKAAFREVPRL